MMSHPWSTQKLRGSLLFSNLVAPSHLSVGQTFVCRTPCHLTDKQLLAFLAYACALLLSSEVRRVLQFEVSFRLHALVRGSAPW